jgi:hypothetical protein
VADLRDREFWARSRWDWDAYGYSNVFPGKITPSDIDMIVERNGHFLVVEMKEWRPDGEWPEPPPMPTGQKIMLERLASMSNWTVLYVAGEAELAAPWHIRHVGGTAVRDLTSIEDVNYRRQFLTEMFDAWAKHVERLSF